MEQGEGERQSGEKKKNRGKEPQPSNRLSYCGKSLVNKKETSRIRILLREGKEGKFMGSAMEGK